MSAGQRHNCLTWALWRRLRFGGEVFILTWRRGEWPHFGWRSGAPGDPWALHWRADDREMPLWRQPLPFAGVPALVRVGEAGRHPDESIHPAVTRSEGMDG